MGILLWGTRTGPIAAAEGKCAGTVETLASCQTHGSSYPHLSLNHFHYTNCLMNKLYAGRVDELLCYLAIELELSPSLGTLPVEISQTYLNKAVSLTIAAPTESWASSLGYDYKATYSLDGTQKMVLYWSGVGDRTKGFLIDGPTHFADDKAADGSTTVYSGAYIQWDRTDPDAQSIQVLASRASSQTTHCTNSATDLCLLGSLTYNATTKRVTSNVVYWDDSRNDTSGDGLGCYRVYATGLYGGQMTIAKTQTVAETTGQTGPDRDATDSSGMDAATIADSSETGDGVGFLNESELTSALSQVSFSKSCNTLLGLTSSFNQAGTRVNFSAGPSDVF